MHPVKYIWALRAIIYKPFFKQIGDMTYIGKPCFIEGYKGIEIGRKTRIFPGIRIEAIDDGEIIIGDNCAIEQNVHIICKNDKLIIGDNTTISANVFISNVNHEYQDIHRSVMEQPLLEKHTIIGKGCFIGYGACILPGTQLGNHCIVGSNAVLNGIYPDNCVIVGMPGKVIKIYDKEHSEWRKRE